MFPPDPISVPGNTKWVVSHHFGFGQTATLVEKIFKNDFGFQKPIGVANVLSHKKQLSKSTFDS